MAASTASSSYAHADGALSSSATSSIAGSSTLYSATGSSSTATATTASSPTDQLRETFTRRIGSLAYLKRSLRGQTTWFSTIQLDPDELASYFDNDRMHKRTLRYSLLGLSLSSILELSNPSDLARAIVSLLNELESYTDDSIAALTSGAGATNFGGQRPKMRSLFKTGKQTLKRSTVAQAISEFGTMDSGIAAASMSAGSSEQSSYLMAPNIPFQLDFFQTFFTLCDILTEIYYKMLSFLPRDNSGLDGSTSNYGTFGRASSPPTSISNQGNQDHDRPGSISQAFSSAAAMGDAQNEAGASINGMTQELLLKADAKIKKVINTQVKDIDGFARQMIKDELASLDPLMKELGLETASNSAVPPSSAVRATLANTGQSSSSGLPTSSASALPFGFTNQPSSTQPSANAPASNTTPSKLSNLVTASQFRRATGGANTVKPAPIPDSSHHGHHHFNLGPNNTTAGTANVEAGNGLITSRSAKLKRIASGTERDHDAAGSASVSPNKQQ
ncbi:hypothetical protein PHSY_001156 [Pseudozyma hubeiensis SY62]|uniref:Uncharacterized protein n=1 Tax=Pseudozyma hubeiensis (strain SY62) TaxID=1305764 RepID=R9NY67_PSEHS|nr:hypothetical protein PHSY_001156 [Pseudozyma hubeiensis SY62]GAC93591.1 hypothetical protein PHSY_001156 [Pseudozyma hubeiensis SY62]